MNNIKKNQINDLYDYLLTISKKPEYKHIDDYFTDMQHSISGARYWCINIFRENPDVFLLAISHIKDKYSTYPSITIETLECYTSIYSGRNSNAKYIGELIKLNLFKEDTESMLSFKKMLLSQLDFFRSNCNLQAIINLLSVPEIYYFLNKKNYRKLNNIKNQFAELNPVFSKYKIQGF